VRIGLDATCLSPNYKGGVNSYAFGLFDAFAKVGNAHEFALFVNPFNREMFGKYASYPNFRLVEIDLASCRPIRRCYQALPWQIRNRLPLKFVNWLVSRAYADIKASEADVHFVPYCPPQLYSFSAKPTVCAIHDIQHIHYPEFFTPEQLLERKVVFKQCIEHATVIQASSRFMRRDFLEHFPSLREDRVVVIREGVDINAFSALRSATDVKTRYGVPEAFLFLPAQLWHHKNHLTVLRALKRLQERGINIPLVLTGARYEASQGIFDFIEQNSLGAQVFYLGTVPFDDLVSLYQSSRFLIMPSLHESSSLPILEAAAAGTPIIASRTPPIEEMAEQLEMQLFTPTDDKALADLLAAVWTDDSLVRRQVEANKTNIMGFSWDNSAGQYIRLFESLAVALGTTHLR
jgi:glycosyltransferase involved in cell wall biosynthesis